MRKLLLVFVLLLLAVPALGANDKVLHTGVGFVIGAGASAIGHNFVDEHFMKQYAISCAVAAPIYFGKELADEKFDTADLAADYIGHTIGFFIMQPVNRLLWGDSLNKQNVALRADQERVELSFTVRW